MTVSRMAHEHLCNQFGGVINCHPLLPAPSPHSQYSAHLLSIEISPSTPECVILQVASVRFRTLCFLDDLPSLASPANIEFSWRHSFTF